MIPEQSTIFTKEWIDNILRNIINPEERVVKERWLLELADTAKQMNKALPENLFQHGTEQESSGDGNG